MNLDIMVNIFIDNIYNSHGKIIVAQSRDMFFPVLVLDNSKRLTDYTSHTLAKCFN